MIIYMFLLDLIAYLVMLAIAIAALGVIILGFVFGVTCIGGFVWGLFNELRTLIIKRT